MSKKTFPAALAIALVASWAFSSPTAEAKTVKKMIVESINYTEKTLKAVKNGDTYTITAANAKIRKGSNTSKSMTFSQIRKGNVITVEGSFDGKDVTASKIRDLSYYDKNTVTLLWKD